MALPWVVLSWRLGQYTESIPLSDDWLEAAATVSDFIHPDTPKGGVEAVGQKVCSLISATMLLMGLWHILRRGQGAQTSSRRSSAGLSLNAIVVRTAFVRIISLGLPIYAAMKLGVGIVALTLLLAFASGLATVESGSKLHGTEGLPRKKMTLSSLLIFVIFSILGLDATPDRAPFKGYLALFLSVFVVRLPFPTLQGVSQPASESSLDAPSDVIDNAISSGQKGPIAPISPLVSSSEDTMLTLITGGLLAFFTASISIFRGTFSSDLLEVVSMLATASSFAVSLTSSPTNLRTPKKIGHAAGSLFAVLVGALPYSDRRPMTVIAWLFLSAFSYIAARFDDNSQSSAGSHAHHHHHHHHSHGHSEVGPSKISELLLRHAEAYPLLHSILKERDSRRIFYFMRYAVGCTFRNGSQADCTVSISHLCSFRCRTALSLGHSGSLATVSTCFLTALRSWSVYARQS